MSKFDYFYIYVALICPATYFVDSFLIITSYCSLMYPSGETPDRSCGGGKMELRCAGKNVVHVGRYYLKCPANGQHLGSFKWYDEYRTGGLNHTNEENGKRVRDIRSPALMKHPYSNEVCAHCCASKSTTEMKINVLICLVGLLLVAVCFMMGKFM